jgi:hypothetical protein
MDNDCEINIGLTRDELAMFMYLLTLDSVQDIPEVVELREKFELALWGANVRPD